MCARPCYECWPVAASVCASEVHSAAVGSSSCDLLLLLWGVSRCKAQNQYGARFLCSPLTPLLRALCVRRASGSPDLFGFLDARWQAEAQMLSSDAACGF
jgi:hypothetical protein